MDLGLKDSVCIITGSSSGIGLETARMLSEEGGRVVVCGRDRERTEIARKRVGASLAFVLDLSDPAAPGELVRGTEEAFGRVDVLVNNVGLAYQIVFEALTEEHWSSIWNLNVMSYVRSIQAALPGMRARRSGVIVNVSSTAGKRPCSSSAF